MDVTWILPDRPQAYDFLLKQDSFFLLLETGDKIIIGEVDWTGRTVIAEPTWTNRTPITPDLFHNY